jgi:hypothetical protein
MSVALRCRTGINRCTPDIALETRHPLNPAVPGLTYNRLPPGSEDGPEMDEPDTEAPVGCHSRTRAPGKTGLPHLQFDHGAAVKLAPGFGLDIADGLAIPAVVLGQSGFIHTLLGEIIRDSF